MLGQGGVFRDVDLGRLGDAEVDDARHRLAVVFRHQDVGGLHVAMDDPLLVGVLDTLAGLDEELEAIANGELMEVAILRDRNASDVFHGEVRPPVGSHAGVQHLGDVRMGHDRQRLALGVEAGDDLLGVHAQLDHLERHLAAYRFLLLGEVDGSHASLAEGRDDSVGADAVGFG